MFRISYVDDIAKKNKGMCKAVGLDAQAYVCCFEKPQRLVDLNKAFSCNKVYTRYMMCTFVPSELFGLAWISFECCAIHESTNIPSNFHHDSRAHRTVHWQNGKWENVCMAGSYGARSKEKEDTCSYEYKSHRCIISAMLIHSSVGRVPPRTAGCIDPRTAARAPSI